MHDIDADRPDGMRDVAADGTHGHACAGRAGHDMPVCALLRDHPPRARGRARVRAMCERIAGALMRFPFPFSFPEVVLIAALAVFVVVQCGSRS